MKRLPNNHRLQYSGLAWTALFLVVVGLTVLVVSGLMQGELPSSQHLTMHIAQICVICGVSLSFPALRFWPARIALGLICCLVITSLAIKATRPDPFERHAHKISDGMTIEEVKSILGEPVAVRPRYTLGQFPSDAKVYDSEGNLVDSNRMVHTVADGKILSFKIRYAHLEVSFNKKNRVVDVMEYLQFPSQNGDEQAEKNH